MNPINLNDKLSALYDTAGSTAQVDPVNITYSEEQVMIDALTSYNQTHKNPFIQGLLGYHHEHGTLSEKQWYYLIRMYLKLDHVAYHSPPPLPVVNNKLKAMLREIKTGVTS